MIEKGADINIQDSVLGQTPLHEAVKRGKADVVKLLIDKEADRNAKNSYDDTLVDIARRIKDPTILAMLKD